MDDETKQAFADLTAKMTDRFADLMAKMNYQHERVLGRLAALDADLRNLRSEHSTIPELVAALPATVLHVIERPLLDRLTSG